AAIVFWDHLGSISKEIQFMWRRSFSIVTLLFYLNRWMTFVWAVFNVTNILPLAKIAVRFSAIRVYAIGRGRLFLVMLVFGLSLVPVGTNIVRLCQCFPYLL
ncbi:hypothetical protein OBBRIDRAFT_726501, partial [Obba rivulosa]